ncbi:MAG: DUF2270 domain-containing protein [Chloroflexi bacterium]|nr:DUF2270 domain-containing protein [Chloroflexota bacterium]MCI0579735.1 DUF2270 domain-containing protein [Chloroflexota bacterium]MCI0644247.1 DUF2270 domain-containing protein [Chloroflexota bacterium]MCI0727566.1 DUF2270 domain-containing protein [Chloroflexota bacterium]
MIEPEKVHTSQNDKKTAEPPNLEQLWQFAGQGLRSSDFNAAMVHFYRGEITRSNMWRQRLDATTNWAVVTTGAIISYAYSSRTNSATAILISTLLVMLFLFIEARRYRYYELWAYRVRLMETNFFAGLLSPPFVPQADWADKISQSLLHPTFPITLWEALGRRYRRNYAPIFLILALSWILKIILHPSPIRDWATFLERAEISILPGWLVLLIGFIVNSLLVALGLFTVGLRKTTSEVLPEVPPGLTGQLKRLGTAFRRATWEALDVELPRPTLQPRKRLAYVISDEVEAIGQALLKDLHRGVTLLQGKGMYTGKEHGVLMCALESRQVDLLDRIVHEKDPKAFVIVTPIQEIHGQWGRPIEA